MRILTVLMSILMTTLQKTRKTGIKSRERDRLGLTYVYHMYPFNNFYMSF